MWNERFSKTLSFLIFLTIILSLVAIVTTENVYEPKIEMVDIGNIEKSTSGITDVWPFETMTITLDPEKFNHTATDGIIRLSLPDSDLELHLTEQVLPEDQRKIKLINESGIFILGEAGFHTYKGKVSGYENSSVSLTIHRNILFGTIDIDENPYHIALTRKSINGKAVMALYRQDNVIVYENVEPETL
ncbi:hypothetical protein [Methanolobus sp. WCC4]|uniref:hypothetical protein n=1 Tax=Methanolobus sp. WCC4 TaxID=3125784 RepID=UPI0030F95F6E